MPTSCLLPFLVLTPSPSGNPDGREPADFLLFTLGMTLMTRPMRVLHRLRGDRRVRAHEGMDSLVEAARDRRYAVAGFPAGDAAADHAGNLLAADGVHLVDS